MLRDSKILEETLAMVVRSSALPVKRVLTLKKKGEEDEYEEEEYQEASQRQLPRSPWRDEAEELKE